MGEKVRGRQSPNTDKMAMESHKQPTNLIISVAWYVFWNIVAAAIFGLSNEVDPIQPATMMLAMYTNFIAIISS